MIVGDTSAVIALIDADDRHHRALQELFEQDPGAWVLPWAVLPEVDYMVATHIGRSAQDAFLSDLAAGSFSVEWGEASDLERAHELCTRYGSLGLGLVDGSVIAVAERLGSDAIATLDLRHFGAVAIEGDPKLFPRDL